MMQSKNESIRQEKPLLSVVVPVYNAEQYLAECIESIQSQTYQNLDVILVDDGAKGREPQICDAYADKDTRIRVLHLTNSGSVVARRVGINAAKGDFITFADADDYLQSSYYEEMMSRLLAEDADLIAAGFMSVSEGVSTPFIQGMPSGVYRGERMTYLCRNLHVKDDEYFSGSIFPSNWTKIYRTEPLRKIAQGIPKELCYSTDSPLTYPYVLEASCVVIANDIQGYCYRRLSNTISTSKNKNIFRSNSMLLEFLRPYYEAMRDPAVMKQWQYIRAYMIQQALMNWMQGVPLRDIHESCMDLKSETEGLSLFECLDALLELPLNDSYKKLLRTIREASWGSFERLWKKQQASMAIRRTAKRFLRREKKRV